MPLQKTGQGSKFHIMPGSKERKEKLREALSLRQRPMLTMSDNLFHKELDFSMSKILLLCWITETGSQLRPQSSLMKSVVFFCQIKLNS